MIVGVVLAVLAGLVVLGLLAGVHWYLWRRLVRDVSEPGGWWRRTGTVLVWVLPLITVATFVSSRGGAPFAVERVLAWPGYLWLALVLYLTLALLLGEAVRPLLNAVLTRRDARRDAQRDACPDGGGGASDAPSANGFGPARPSGAVPAPGAASPDRAPASRAPSGGVLEAGGVRHAAADSSEAVAVAADGGSDTAAAAVDVLAEPAGPAEAGGVPGPPTSAPDGAADGPSTAGETPPAATAAATAADGSGTEGGENTEGVQDGERGPGAAEGSAPAADPREPSRRLFVARAVAAGAALVGAGTVAAGAYDVLGGPALKRITVPLAKLPRRAHGYRIAVVSDVHLGPILGRAHTQRIVDTINGAQPDLVAIVGDLVDGTVNDLGPAARPLNQLRSRDGNFFVTGNHEYFGDADEWIGHLAELGVRTLQNTRRELPWFDLAGVNDIQGEEEDQGPDFRKALGDRDTSRASVLLAHQPVQIHDAVDHGVDLQLSGHSHGGQLWPGEYLAAFANPTVAGLERYGDTQLYVTRGAGAWGPPVRVGAESDVTLVQLAAKSA